MEIKIDFFKKKIFNRRKTILEHITKLQRYLGVIKLTLVI